ncbi:MAG: hypothetical protein MR009_04785 [Sutterellaceae bacterium]|nr:hypothetical protein [Sutterellaceae bacterium]MDY2867631.1 hypothetical protein [Mesosutterella sp.]
MKMKETIDFGSPEDYLPQRPPMLLISRITKITEEGAECEADASILKPFRREDRSVPEALYIELLAQTVGVWSGYWRKNRGETVGDAPLGFLLSVRSFAVKIPKIAEEGALAVKITKLIFEGSLGSFEGNVEAGDRMAASGRVSVYQPSLVEFRKLFPENKKGE